MQFAVDLQEAFIEVPDIARCRPPPPEPSCEFRGELQIPATDAFVGDEDAARCQTMSLRLMPMPAIRLTQSLARCCRLILSKGARFPRGWHRHSA